MADKTRKTAKLKLIMGIVISVFIMIASLIMVSVSFAWFSDSATVEIATINLATKKVFTLEFDMQSLTQDKKYTGETALHRDEYLITPYRKTVAKKSDEFYLDDAPFMFKTTFLMATDEMQVDLNMNFTFAQIEHVTYKKITDDNGEEIEVIDTDIPPYDFDIYGAESENDTSIHPVTTYTSAQIPFAFTWFFVATGEDLYSADYVYTPYGTMKFASDTYESVDPETGETVRTPFTYCEKLNGKTVTSIIGQSGTAEAGTLVNGKQDIKGFIAEKTGDQLPAYDFYIVFAPEKLFWMQFFPDDRDLQFTNTLVYSEQDLKTYICKGRELTDCTQMYYAKSEYIGAVFNFMAEINVTEVYWDEEEG